MSGIDREKATELPVACSLDARAGSERLARWRALGAAGAPTVRREPDQFVVRYRPSAGLLEQLKELVAAEQECCAFADWQVSHDPDGVELCIRSDEHGLAAIAAFLDAAKRDISGETAVR